MASRAPTSPERSTPTKQTKQAKDGPLAERSRDVAPTPMSRGLIQRAAIDPGSLSQGDVTAMHRTIGNRAVGRLVGGARAMIQCKLRVGAAGDKYEQEADRIAEEVAGPGKISAPRKAAPRHFVQRASGLEGGDVDRSIEDRIRGEGGGASLPQSVRAALEPRLGVDLGGVRTHTGEKAASISGELGARAFTHKNHIYYGADHSPSDLALTAHEVVHTIQQGATGDPVIQRNVGFEFESGSTKVRYPAGHPVTPNGLYASKDTLAKIDNSYDVTTDSGDLEIVTTDFPETKEGRANLDTALVSIEQYCAGVFAKGVSKKIGGASKRVVTFEQLSDVAPANEDKKNYQIAAPIGGRVSAHPQATAGIDMTKLFTLLEGMSDKDSEMFKVTGWDRRKLFAPQIDSVKGGVDKARSYIDGIEDEEENDYEKLKGLLAQIYGIILVAQASADTEAKYAKFLMPIMQRTDFASIYKLLDAHEKETFRTQKDAILGHIGVAADAELFPGGIKEWKGVGDTPTIGQFYDGIVAGRDVLASWSNAGSGWGDAIDIGPVDGKRKRPGAIFELRRLKDDIPSTQWRSFALGIFDLVTMLNQDKVFESEESQD